MSEEKLGVVVIDDGSWVQKTLIHEIKQRQDVDIINTLSVKEGESLEEILNRVDKPDTLELDEYDQVTNKTVIWLPFTSDGMRDRKMRDDYNKIRDNYPHLNIAFPYENMTRGFLHELARKAGIVPINDTLTADGKSVPKVPPKQKPEEINPAFKGFKVKKPEPMKKENEAVTNAVSVSHNVDIGSVATSTEVETTDVEKGQKTKKVKPQ